MRHNQEHQTQAALIKWAAAAAAKMPELDMLFAIPNGGARNRKTGAMLKAEGVRPGVPDLCLPVPSTRYNALYIELKTINGAPGRGQAEWCRKLRQHGNAAVFCYGLEAAIYTVKRYLEGHEVPEVAKTPNPKTRTVRT